jgi:hypothetical protein
LKFAVGEILHPPTAGYLILFVIGIITMTPIVDKKTDGPEQCWSQQN